MSVVAVPCHPSFVVIVGGGVVVAIVCRLLSHWRCCMRISPVHVHTKLIRVRVGFGAVFGSARSSHRKQPEMVHQQLRALAILDTAIARQRGYPQRVSFQEFIRR